MCVRSHTFCFYYVTDFLAKGSGRKYCVLTVCYMNWVGVFFFFFLFFLGGGVCVGGGDVKTRS